MKKNYPCHNRRKKHPGWYKIPGILCMVLLLSAGCGDRKGSGEEAAWHDILLSPEPAGGITDSAGKAGSEDLVNPSGKTDLEENPKTDRNAAGTSDGTDAQVTLLMAGDILLHMPVEESALREDGSYDFGAVFANVEDEIRDADIAIVNQEVIIGGRELGISGYPAFNAPYEIGDALADAGFDVICHATNHALDKGKQGLLNCLDFWKTRYPDLAVLGIHDNAESQNTIYIREENGIRIAILNYTYGTNGIPLPGDMPYGVDLLEEDRVKADLGRGEEMADFTVVCPHWGTEYELGISAEQEKWTKLFLDNGADLVLGTHPHVIEPIEWVISEETEETGEGEIRNTMLVYYSLGNFVNWTSGMGEGVANRMVGGMARVTVEKSEDGETRIGDYDVIPIVCHVEEGRDGVTVYALSDYTNELAGRNAIVKQDPAFTLEYCQKLCSKVWGGEE